MRQLKYVCITTALICSAPAAFAAMDVAIPAHAAWCMAAAMGQGTGQAYQGSSLYSLRNVGQVNQKALAELKDKPLRLRDRLAALLAPKAVKNTDFSAPNLFNINVVYNDFNEPGEGRDSQMARETVQGRLTLLEDDVTTLKAGEISFGTITTGTEDVTRQIEALKATATQLDVNFRSYREQQLKYLPSTTYNAKRNWVPFALSSTIVTMGMSSIYLATGNAGSIFDFAAPMAAFNTLYAMLAEWKGTPQVLDALAAKIFPAVAQARAVTDGSTQAVKAVAIAESILSFLKAPEAHPDALTYHGFSFATSSEIVDEMLKASDEHRLLDPIVLRDGLVKYASGIPAEDVRYVVIDQLFFFDSATHQPVLLNFMRIKRPGDFVPPRRRRKADEKEKASVTERQWAAGMDAVPVRVPVSGN